MQAAGIGVVVHSRGLVERAPLGDLNSQLSCVDAADQPSELGSVAADEDPLRADCAPRILWAEDHGADMEAAVGDHTDEGFSLFVGGADQVEHHIERSTLDLDR